jgi:hypothetical protein
MLKLFLQILLLIIVFKLISPLFRGIVNMFKSPPKKQDAMEKKQDYSELSPYEIEDAEYEEVRKGKD